MAKWRKKPVEVVAQVYKLGMEDGFGCPHGRCLNIASICTLLDGSNRSASCGLCGEWRPYILTLEGRLFITEGDYIVTGVEGERYPCKPDIFHKTYERVE